MNNILLIGNLVKEPEKVDGQELCKLNIAVRNKYKNKDGEYDSEFFNIAVWNKLHENCMKYLHKGSKIAVSGELHIRHYEKDGVKKYIPEIVAHEVEFCFTPQKNEDVKMTPIDEDDWQF